MFSHEGPARTLRKNAVLAAWLAAVAGFVNSAGFTLIGTFTSHVTGNLGRASHDVATGNTAAATFALLLVGAFFAGAFVASLIIEGVGQGYGVALLGEGALLATFVAVVCVSRSTGARALDAEAAILCLAMGMQNSLVTRLSGAVVRTTHVTGVVTDLAIESAQWYRWFRAKLPAVPVVLPGRTPVVRPDPTRVLLLAIIVGAFTTGALCGAIATIAWRQWAMLAPAAAICGASAFALRSRSRDGARASHPPARAELP